jgi:hypothetical protein
MNKDRRECANTIHVFHIMKAAIGGPMRVYDAVAVSAINYPHHEDE